MTQTAFVTGATGFVGSHVARELHRRGWAVHVLARPTSSLEDLSDVPVTVHLGDVVDAASVDAAMPPDVDGVFHVAASTNLWSRNNAAQSRINLDGTRNLLDAAEAAGARRFVHTSSFVAWGFLDREFNEDSPRTDATDWINYVRTKHLSEQMVLDAAAGGRVDAVILNPGNVLGPGDRHNWSRLFRMVNDGSLPGAPPGGGNFCDVREVARAHVQAWHRGATGQRYLLGGEFASYLQVIVLAGEMLGAPVPGKPTPSWILAAVARAKSLLAALTGKKPDLTPEEAAIITHEIRCDSGRAQRELDYRAMPLRDMVLDTIEWMRGKGL
ncbi:MAG: SDR family oxidoreductase, partial [Xanthomonadales bacterium]|nr:SDR family oxidoreductase [Xanthomonadales bacterium]